MSNKPFSKSSKKRGLLNRRLVFVGLGVALIIIFGLWYGLRNHHQAAAVTTTLKISKTSLSPQSASNSIPTTASTTDKSSGSQGTPAASTTTTGSGPAAPNGTDFVSDHNPSLSTRSSENSVCSSTAGASCYIEFSNSNGDVVKLPTQTLDNSGNTYWSWDVKQNNLSVGSWQITAVATLNGQTQSAQDPLNLTVRP